MAPENPENKKPRNIRRRSILRLIGKGVVAAGSTTLNLTAIGGTAHLYKWATDNHLYITPKNPHIDYGKCAEALAPYLKGDKNIFLGDTNHFDTDMFGMITHPENDEDV